MQNLPRPDSSIARQAAGLAVSLLVTCAAAAVGAVASAGAPAFYEHLVRPTWAPPASLFGPVWSALYGLMAIAAWLVWRGANATRTRPALTIFLAQLVANAVWSWLFFGWRQGGLAFAEVLLLWGLIVANVIAFWRLNVLAAALLLPYLAWVTFASALTFAVWRGNPGLL
jgi:translocator protein